MTEGTYSGPERRRHFVLVTHNTEYHMRDRVCVAVRDVASGSWQPAHRALGRKVLAAMQSLHFEVEPARPSPGSRLLFDGDLLTSPVIRIRRPSRDTVQLYSSAS